MRDIKFRAWDKEKKKMGDLDFLTIRMVDGVYLLSKDNTGIDGVVVELMQYTGLKDKNGVEIFESDIVEWTTTLNKTSKTVHIDVMTWDEGLAYFVLMPWVHEPSGALMKVIGNIHENPELLKG